MVMGVDKIKEGFEGLVDDILDDLEDVNEKLDAANQFYRAQQPLSGENFWEQVERAEAHYKTLDQLVDNPLYEAEREVFEALGRTEEVLSEVSEYTALDFAGYEDERKSEEM